MKPAHLNPDVIQAALDYKRAADVLQATVEYLPMLDTEDERVRLRNQASVDFGDAIDALKAVVDEHTDERNAKSKARAARKAAQAARCTPPSIKPRRRRRTRR